MLGLFKRARLFANLAPAERALLKLIELTLVAAAVAGVQAVVPVLNTGDLAAIPWPQVAHTFIAAALVALGGQVSQELRRSSAALCAAWVSALVC
jgi:hypothetical protein